MGEALKQNNSLTSLNLSGNRIGCEGGTAFGDALQHNNTLTNLDLEKIKLGSKESQQIGEGLIKNSNHQTLSLGENYIEVERVDVTEADCRLICFGFLLIVLIIAVPLIVFAQKGGFSLFA
mmetsp:Transcript_28402/g.34678  ORF Transcript_28402/g.34678 Transcript_28402/m.34678 type:complete len:121 (+) Transcript_28402:637-999(+)